MKLLNDEIKIYEIDSKYIQFLREADRRVSVKKHRPFVGILVNVEEIYYCVPLTDRKSVV